MRIYSSTRRQLDNVKKQNDDYINRYNSQKALYEEYKINIEEELKSIFHNELENLPNTKIELQKRNDCDEYAVRIYHYTSIRQSAHYQDILEYFPKNAKNKRYFNGIRWNLLIYTNHEFTRTKSNDDIIKIPQLYVEHTDYEDLAELKLTYEFFEKVENFDWVSFFNKVYEECPKLNEFKTNLSDGSLNLKELHNKEAVTYLDSVLGKDIWVLCKDINNNIYKAFDNRHLWAYPHSKYWVKIKSATNSFYVIDIIYYYDHNRKLENFKVKKTSIELVSPIECRTTAELDDESEE